MGGVTIVTNFTPFCDLHGDLLILCKFVMYLLGPKPSQERGRKLNKKLVNAQRDSLAKAISPRHMARANIEELIFLSNSLKLNLK